MCREVPDPSPSEAGVGACWWELVSPCMDVIPEGWRETPEGFAVAFGAQEGFSCGFGRWGHLLPTGQAPSPIPKGILAAPPQQEQSDGGEEGEKVQGPLGSDSVLPELKISRFLTLISLFPFPQDLLLLLSGAPVLLSGHSVPIS